VAVAKACGLRPVAEDTKTRTQVSLPIRTPLITPTQTQRIIWYTYKVHIGTHGFQRRGLVVHRRRLDEEDAGLRVAVGLRAWCGCVGESMRTVHARVRG
jgi:hypothetical protein